MTNIEFLSNLLNSYGPSGYEGEVTDLFRCYCEQNECKFEFNDSIGNMAFSVGKEDGIPFMLSGHVDEIGLQVQYVDNEGFVHFIKDGGVDPKTVIGREVVILSRNGDINGVIGKTPIHIEHVSEEKDKVTKLSNLKIDIGAFDKKNALANVSVGDPIVFRHKSHMLLNHRIACGSIDDRVGVYVTAEVLKKFKEYPLKALKIYGVACTQEEVGGHGASLAAKRINPKYSIDYDVTFATDDGMVKKEEWGDIKLGKGGCIAFGPDKNDSMVKNIVNCCERHAISYQTFSVGAGMTNTLKIKLASDDCQTALLSIPQRNMHTQVEVCDTRDLDSLIQMTYYFIRDLDESIAKQKK